MTTPLERSLEFMRLMHEFQAVERVVPVLGTDRRENDAEHSYSLSMLAWYLCNIITPSLDKNLVIKYALVHDIVEAYAGDTFAHTTNADLRASKHRREEDARLRIESEFPDFAEMNEFIEAYERRDVPESRFVYALDKLITILTMYIDTQQRDSWWKKHDVTFAQLCEYKDPKLALSPEVNELWQELRAILEQGKENLFA
jgi:putative hydrolases of HD superfamily